MKKLTLLLLTLLISTMMWSQYFKAGFSSTHIPQKQYASFLKTYGNIVKAKASSSKVPYEVVLTIMATENQGKTSHPLNNFSKLKPHKKLLIGKFAGTSSKSGLIIFGKSRHCAEVTIDAIELLAKMDEAFTSSHQDWLLLVYGEGKDLEPSAPAAELAYQFITGKSVKLLPQVESPVVKTPPQTEQTPVDKTKNQQNDGLNPVKDTPPVSVVESEISEPSVEKPDQPKETKVVLPVIKKEVSEKEKIEKEVINLEQPEEQESVAVDKEITPAPINNPAAAKVPAPTSTEKENNVSVLKTRIVAGPVPSGCQPFEAKYDKNTDATKLVYGRLLQKGKKRKSGDKGPALDFQLMDNKLYLTYSSPPPSHDLRISQDTPLLIKLTSGEFIKFTINKTEKKVISTPTDNTFYAFAPMSMTQLQKLGSSPIEMVRIADHSMIYIEELVHDKAAKRLIKDAGCLFEQVSIEKYD